MAYVVEIGIIDTYSRKIPDDSARDYYNDFEESRSYFNKLTKEFVINFLEKDLGFEETDKGCYKKLSKDNAGTIDFIAW